MIGSPSLLPAPRLEWPGGWEGGEPLRTSQLSVPSTDVQAATTGPIFLPSLKGSCFDHPSAPAPKSSKKPKMQAAGNTFPNDWSPPPVEFLNLRIPQANAGDPSPRPRGLRRLAHQHPEVSEQEPQDLDRLGGLASLEDPFWTVTGTSPEAATPGMGAHTSVSQGPPRLATPLWPLLQSHRQAIPSWPLLFSHTPTTLLRAPPLDQGLFSTPSDLFPAPGPS